MTINPRDILAPAALAVVDAREKRNVSRPGNEWDRADLQLTLALDEWDILDHALLSPFGVSLLAAVEEVRKIIAANESAKNDIGKTGVDGLWSTFDMMNARAYDTIRRAMERAKEGK